MTISKELQNLEKVQARLIRFCKYLEKQEQATGSNYSDLYRKVSCVIGTIENTLNFEKEQ